MTKITLRLLDFRNFRNGETTLLSTKAAGYDGSMRLTPPNPTPACRLQGPADA